MKIDFKNMKMMAGISDENSYLQDVRESFANVIYKGMNGIAALELARKIYHSDGTEEYTDEEINMIRNASYLCTPQFIESVTKSIEKQL